MLLEVGRRDDGPSRSVPYLAASTEAHPGLQGGHPGDRRDRPLPGHRLAGTGYQRPYRRLVSSRPRPGALVLAFASLRWRLCIPVSDELC
jgi:hypothetical protein